MHTREKRKTWLSPKVIFRTFAVLGCMAFVIALVTAYIPETNSVSSIQVADDEIILTVPTTGRISHFKQIALRYLEIWAGRIDRTRFQEWLAALPESDRDRGAFPAEVTAWPELIEENLPPDLRSKPFITAGDRVRTWGVGYGRYYELRVNETTGAFTLIRAEGD